MLGWQDARGGEARAKTKAVILLDAAALNALQSVSHGLWAPNKSFEQAALQQGRGMRTCSELPGYAEYLMDAVPGSFLPFPDAVSSWAGFGS